MKIHEASIMGEKITFESVQAADGEDYADHVRKYTIPTGLQSQLGAPGSKFELQITYSAPITKDLEGIYYAYSQTAEYGRREIITTQLESHFARKMWPCVDEPEAKAVYEFTFTADKGLEVLFNTVIDILFIS